MNKSDFENYKLIHRFYYNNEPLKKWVNDSNYIDTFKRDWNELMHVIEKIEKEVGWRLIIYNNISYWNTANFGERYPTGNKESSKIKSCYQSFIQYLVWKEKVSLHTNNCKNHHCNNGIIVNFFGHKVFCSQCQDNPNEQQS